MNKAFGAFVVVTGLVLAAGCAREDRWTLDGSRPGPINDHKGAPRVETPEARSAAAANEKGDAARAVELTKENDYCVVRNKGDQPVEITVQVTPGTKNAQGDLPRNVQVFVPASEQVQIGRLKDACGNEWSYRLLGAAYK